jgi:hypothetical protein
MPYNAGIMMTDRFELRLAPELLDRIERWRLRQPVAPTKAAAIRYIIELGLDAVDKGQAPPGGSPPGSSPRKPAGPAKPAAPQAKKPTASDRQATAAQTKEAQIRALREQGADET